MLLLVAGGVWSDVSFTHVVLLKDVQALTKYYASTSYANQNETYILKTNGSRMNDGLSQEKTIQSYNVLNALEELGGGHIRDALKQADTVSGSFIRDGVEHYYCITALRSYDNLKSTIRQVLDSRLEQPAAPSKH